LALRRGKGGERVMNPNSSYKIRKRIVTRRTRKGKNMKKRAGRGERDINILNVPRL